MGLTHLVNEAKKNTPVLKRADPSVPVPNLIEIGTDEELKKEREDVSWQDCLHLVRSNGKPMCKLYFSNCAMNQCKKKHRN